MAPCRDAQAPPRPTHCNPFCLGVSSWGLALAPCLVGALGCESPH